MPEIDLVKGYCFSQPLSFDSVSASSSSLASMSMPAGTLKLALGGLVELVASMLVAPMDSRLVRTAETQLPQVMPGTLMATLVMSPVASVATVLVGSPQPMKATVMATATQESRLRI